MTDEADDKNLEWQGRARAKGAIVPHYWEVFTDHVIIDCGACHTRYSRNLVPNVNDPTFVCPLEGCRAKNWVPITYKLNR